MDLLKTLGGAMGGGDKGSLLTTILPLLQQHGGLQGLLKQFEGAGLGNIIQSWIGTGDNLPISADQVTKALGGSGGLLDGVAKETGMAPDAAAGSLAKLLPGLVDTLSPDGNAPSGNLVDLAKSALGSGALGKLFG